MGPAFHDREYPRHVGGDDYLPSLRTDARHSATGYSLKGQICRVSFGLSSKANKAHHLLCSNLAAMKDSGRIRGMNGYGTAASESWAPLAWISVFHNN